MTTPENTFIASVNRHLPPKDEFHREKMANPYTSGTADYWYSSRLDMWVEYKFLQLPKRDDTIVSLVGGKKPMLAVLQQEWLKRRHREGREVYVIVGCAEGGVIFKYPEWGIPHSANFYRTNMRTRKEIAQFILARIGPL
jgi:hypothetical protein